MKLKNFKTVAIVSIIAGVIAACAEYPDKPGNEEPVSTAAAEGENQQREGLAVDASTAYNNQELEMALADAESAMELARADGGAWSLTEDKLAASKEAMANGDVNVAVELAIAAEQEAKMAHNQSQLEDANFTLNRVKSSHPNLSADQLEKIADAENAYLEDNGAQAHEIAAALLADVGGSVLPNQMASREHNMEKMVAAENTAKSKKMVASTAPVALGEEVRNGESDYKVVRGDSLWGISAKPVIYNNPYQWPLIYKANKATIKDPDLIQPGQRLEIDRHATPADIERAVHHAKTRGAWVLGSVEPSDQDYISKSEQSGVASR